MALIREANASTSSSTALISLADLAALGQQDKPRSPFGELKIEYPQEVSTMTLAAAARCEWNAIEAALRKVLPAE